MLVMLVWKITQFCKQIKTNQVFKIKSLVLNRVAKWTVIVLNRFSVWGPWWYTSSQTFFSWPTFFPLPGTRGHSKKMALNKLSLPKANEISSDLKVFFRTWNLAEFMLYPKIVYQKKWKTKQNKNKTNNNKTKTKLACELSSLLAPRNVAVFAGYKKLIYQGVYYRFYCIPSRHIQYIVSHISVYYSRVLPPSATSSCKRPPIQPLHVSDRDDLLGLRV